VHALLRAVQRRERLADGATFLARTALPTGLLVATAALVAARLLGAPLELAFAALLPVPAALLWAYLRPRSRRVTARRIDAHYGLHDQLGSALELAGTRPGHDPRSAGIVELLAQEADNTAGTVDPRPVVALRVPGPRRVDGLATVALLAAMLLPEYAHEPEAAPPAAREERPASAATEKRPRMDLALAEPLRQDLRELEGKDDEAARTAEALLEILDALQRGEIDREQAFEQLDRLDRELTAAEDEFEAQLEEDPALLAEAMRELAEALQQEEITEEAGRALDRGDSEEAEDKLNEASDEAESGDASDREAMQRAMEAAERQLAKAASRASDTASSLAEAERRLRRQEKRPAADPEEQERRLKRQRERVAELRRQHEREAAARRRLEQLRRDARQAAGRKGGAQNRKDGARKLGRGMGDASRKARRASRLSRARDGVEEAKTFIRRAGKQGENEQRRRKQFRKFSKAAKGKRGKKGKPTMLIEGDVGDGEPTGMMMEGEGEQGQDGEGEGEAGESEGGSHPSSMPADGIGDGTVEPLGDPTRKRVKYRDARADAKKGRGATRAEVIRTSSQEGFATEPYRDVYDDYRGVAQSALDGETIPGPQRRRIKRYFQLIQPRK
jgi:hypothetical protein